MRVLLRKDGCSRCGPRAPWGGGDAQRGVPLPGAECCHDTGAAAQHQDVYGEGGGHIHNSVRVPLRSTAAKGLCLIVGPQEVLTRYSCLGAYCPQCGPLDPWLARHGKRRRAPVRVLAQHSDVFTLPDQPESQNLECLDNPRPGSIDWKLLCQRLTAVSAMKASRTGGSRSST